MKWKTKYLGKKKNGIVITIDPPKIPRVIGRDESGFRRGGKRNPFN